MAFGPETVNSPEALYPLKYVTETLKVSVGLNPLTFSIRTQSLSKSINESDVKSTHTSGEIYFLGLPNS